MQVKEKKGGQFFNLIHGDCLIEMPKLIEKGVQVDMILCDLPYGVTNNSWDNSLNPIELWECYNKLIKKTGRILLTSTQPYTTDLIVSNRDGFSHIWYWKKGRATGFQRVAIEPMRTVEEIVVFNKALTYDDVETTPDVIKFKEELKRAIAIPIKELNKKCGFEASGYLRKSSSWKNVLPTEEKLKTICHIVDADFEHLWSMARQALNTLNVVRKTFNPQGIIPCSKKNKRGSVGSNWSELSSNEYDVKFENYPTNFLEFSSSGNKHHPTEKPVPLMEYLINTYTNEGEVVLDNCMGSCTTGVAAKNTNRSFIGIEKDENYFKIAQERINSTEPNPNNFEKVEAGGLFSFWSNLQKLD